MNPSFVSLLWLQTNYISCAKVCHLNRTKNIQWDFWLPWSTPGLTNSFSFSIFYLFIPTLLLHSLLSLEEKPPSAPDGRSASGCQVRLSVNDWKCQCEAQLMQAAKSAKQRLKISSIWHRWGQTQGIPAKQRPAAAALASSTSAKGNTSPGAEPLSSVCRTVRK